MRSFSSLQKVDIMPANDIAKRAIVTCPLVIPETSNAANHHAKKHLTLDDWHVIYGGVMNLQAYIIRNIPRILKPRMRHK